MTPLDVVVLPPDIPLIRNRLVEILAKDESRSRAFSTHSEEANGILTGPQVGIQAG